MPSSPLLNIGVQTITSVSVMAVSNSNAALVTFIVYSALVMGLAVVSHRLLAGRNFLAEYFLGSRNLATWAFMLTFAATSASAGSFAGFPALVYTHGWVSALYIAGYMTVPLIGIGLLGKRINCMARRTGAITVPDLLGRRFGHPAVVTIATLMIVFLLSFYLVPQFKLASIILQTLLTDVPAWHGMATIVSNVTSLVPWLGDSDPEYLLGLLLFSVMVVAYTSVGGFRAVVWTDILQGFVMFAGVFVMLVLVLQQVGGPANASRSLHDMQPPRLCKFVFHRAEAINNPDDWTANPASSGAIRIPGETLFFELQDDANLADVQIADVKYVFRTNEPALIAVGESKSGQIKGAQIITSADRLRCLEEWKTSSGSSSFVHGLPAGTVVEYVDAQEYAYGAGQKGVYTTTPGPSFENDNGFLPIAMAISFFMMWTVGNAGQPGNMVRLMAFDRVRSMKRAIAMLVVYYGVTYLAIVTIFCCARILVPGLDHQPDKVMAVLSLKVSTDAGVPWLAGLLVAAPFAAAMSTVDSFMLMISSSMVRDVYQRSINPDASERTVKRLSFLCTMTVGVMVAIAAIDPPRFLQRLIEFTGGGLSSVFLIPVALALYWPRFNSAGAIAGMLGGFFCYVSLYVIGMLILGESKPLRPFSLDPLIWGFAGSAGLAIIICWCTPPPPLEIKQAFFGKPMNMDIKNKQGT